jgi:hypothetical protein
MWPWFCAWFLVDALTSLGLLTVLTVDVFLLPVTLVGRLPGRPTPVSGGACGPGLRARHSTAVSGLPVRGRVQALQRRTTLP